MAANNCADLTLEFMKSLVELNLNLIEQMGKMPINSINPALLKEIRECAQLLSIVTL